MYWTYVWVNGVRHAKSTQTGQRRLAQKIDDNYKEKLLLLSTFTGGYGPVNGAHLVMDAAGNLYGTTYGGGAYRQGDVFKRSPGVNGWSLTDLHDFNRKDGSGPTASIILDANGNIYGTTTEGGDLSVCPIIGCGVVFEITP